jgi:catechol 2,3-dioxygenase-like lactoylglutathione lyase family enzyme
MTSQIGVITILVSDMQRSKEFYTDLLGFEVAPEFSSPAGDFLFLRSKAGGPNLALQDANIQSFGIPLVHGGLIVGFIVEDADAVYRDWQGRNVEITSEVGDIGAGRLFNAKDPDGNYIQVYHLYPHVLEMQKQQG